MESKKPKKVVMPAASLMEELRKALEDEHCLMCNSSTCDIDAAYRAGCYLWAASLLVNATDEGVDKTTAAYEKISPSASQLEHDRVVLVTTVPHVACFSCNSTNWSQDVGADCGGCGTVLQAPKIEGWARMAGSQHPYESSKNSDSTLRSMAGRGQKILGRYQKMINGEEADYESALADVLTDLRHFCDMEGLDFAAALDSSENHYGDEVNGD